MNNYKQLKKNKFSEGENPESGNAVIGFDEVLKIEVEVSYRRDSNRFFEHPYTGAVYSFDRMNKWRNKI